jgi:hypothetical protein
MSNRIAVLGIHGVADQKPCETARIIADLLGVGAPGNQRACFVEESLRLPLARLHQVAFQEHETFDPAGKLMSRQLAGYDPRTRHAEGTAGGEEGRVHETLRLRGILPASNGSAQEVHVFEMYWGDLSRLGVSLLQGISELFQLLFFLCTLGAETVKLAAAEEKNRKSLTVMHALVVGVEAGLAWLVPMLNLMLLSLGLLIIPLCFEPRTNLVIAGVMGGVLTLGLLTWAALQRLPLGGPLGSWLARSGGWAGLGIVCLSAGIGLLTGWLSLRGPAMCLTILLFAGALGGFMLMARSYARRQPGAWPVAVGLALVMGALFPCELWQRWESVSGWGAEVETNLLLMVFRLAEYLLVLLYLSWLLVMLAAALCLPVCGWVRWGGGSEGANWKARRATWTGMLAAVMPSFLVIVSNLALWSALLMPVLPKDSGRLMQTSMVVPKRLLTTLDNTKASPLPFREAVIDFIKPPNPRDASTDAKTPALIKGRCFLKRLLSDGNEAVSLFVVMLTLAMVIFIACLLPAVISDIWESKAKNTKIAALNLGVCLSRGYKQMRLALLVLGCTLLWLCVVPRLPVNAWFLEHGGNWLHGQSATLVLSMGAGLVAMVALSHGPLKFLALGTRTVVDVALDVVNWLREHPKDDNVRSRITERYVSILRHLCAESSGYDAVIIVAHSQGTMIAADVMRHLWSSREALLKSGSEPSLARWLDGRLPLHLFTMGSPLRQHYSQRFPHLYAWARADVPQKEEKAAAAEKPRAEEVGVITWVNAYRSGDYVGRCLWHDEQDEKSWVPGGARPVVHDDPSRQEFCIGPGGHTHYWDVTAPAIASQLRSMVQKVAGR